MIDHETLFRVLPLGGVGLALDLGCGAGRYTLELAARLIEDAGGRLGDLVVPVLTLLVFWLALLFFRRFATHFEDFF